MGIINIGQESVKPDAPSTSRYKIYPKADGFYYIDANGNEERFGVVSDTIFGTEFALAKKEITETNNQTTFNTYLNTNWNNIDFQNGTYRVEVKFIWGMSTASSSFKARLLIGGVQFGREFYKETKDQTDENIDFFVEYLQPNDLTQSGVSVQLQYAVESNGNTATMHEAFITIWRVA